MLGKEIIIFELSKIGEKKMMLCDHTMPRMNMKGASFLPEEEVFEAPSLCALPSERVSKVPSLCVLPVDRASGAPSLCGLPSERVPKAPSLCVLRGRGKIQIITKFD